MRHARSFRSGSLDGVSKNRWSGYAGARPIRLDGPSDNTSERENKEKSKGALGEIQVPQRSLLEVFEAELAKEEFKQLGKAKHSNHGDNFALSEAQQSSSASPDITSSNSGAEPSVPSVSPIIDGIKLLGSHLQDLAVSEEAQELSKVVDAGVRTAASAFESLMQRLISNHQEPLLQSTSAKVQDPVSIDDTISSLRGFVKNITSDLDPLGKVATVADSKSVDMRKVDAKENSCAVGREPSTLSASAQSNKSQASDESIATMDTALLPAPSPVDQQLLESIVASNDSHSPSEGPSSSPAESRLRHIANRKPSPGPLIDEDSLPRYHEPGPIHLTHDTQRRATTTFLETKVSSARGADLDHSRREPATENVKGFRDDRASSPFPAVTRFPSLAQFENQHITRLPSFPALPSMKPLLPQQKTNQSMPEDVKRSRANVDDFDPFDFDAFLRHSNCSHGKSKADRPLDPDALLHKTDDPQQKAAIETYFKAQGINAAQSNDRQHVSAAVSPNICPSRHSALTEHNNQLELEQDEGSSPVQSSKLPDLLDQIPHDSTHSQASSLSGQHGSPSRRDLSPAARLVHPFDPLLVEPTARAYWNDGINRHATDAGTYIKSCARARRPYSDAFDGNGRIPWDSFLPDVNVANCSPRQHALPSKPQQSLQRGREKFQERQGRLNRGVTLSDNPRWTSPSRQPENQHADSSTVSSVAACVDNLMKLGYDRGKKLSLERLMVYAQAANGDLLEAMDMIEEEQRVYTMTGIQ